MKRIFVLGLIIISSSAVAQQTQPTVSDDDLKSMFEECKLHAQSIAKGTVITHIPLPGWEGCTKINEEWNSRPAASIEAQKAAQKEAKRQRIIDAAKIISK